MTFCRFGFDEALTFDDLRQLIANQELHAHDLLLVGDSTEWKAARNVPELRGFFPVVSAPEAKLPPKRLPLPPLPQLERPPYRPNPMWLIAIVVASIILLVNVVAILRGQIGCGTVMSFLFGMMVVIVAVSALRAKL